MGPSNGLSCEAGSFSCHLHPQRFFQSEVLRPYFPTWVVHSVSLPSCSCWSTSHRLAASLLCPSCLSPPFLPVWMNISSLTPWLSDFQTVGFSGSSYCFLFLNLLSFFWFCEEGKHSLSMPPSWPEIQKVNVFKVKTLWTRHYI